MPMLHCGTFQFFSTSMINIAIYDYSNWYSNETSTTAERWPPNRAYMTSSCMTSSQVTQTFTSITRHRIEIKHWAGCHCVFLVKTHRMIYNMTYLGHLSGQVIWPDLRLKFQIDLSRSRFTCFDVSWREEYDGVSRFSLSFLVQKLFAKSLIFPKKQLFSLTCPGKV